jgi:hypothetical protein
MRIYVAGKMNSSTKDVLNQLFKATICVLVGAFYVFLCMFIGMSNGDGSGLIALFIGIHECPVVTTTDSIG